MGINANIDTPINQETSIIQRQGKAYDYQGRRYIIDSTDSMIDLVIERSNPGEVIVFHNDDGIITVFNPGITERPPDTAKYCFDIAQDIQEWLDIVNHPKNGLKQKDFLDFLKCKKRDQVPGVELLIAEIQKFKMATTITGEFDYEDDNNVNVVFKMKDGEGNAKLPKVINLKMPIIENSDFIFDLEIELSVKKPKAEDERPEFSMKCPKWKRYWKDAVELEIEKLKDKLGMYGILILAGSFEE